MWFPYEDFAKKLHLAPVIDVLLIILLSVRVCVCVCVFWEVGVLMGFHGVKEMGVLRAVW